MKPNRILYCSVPVAAWKEGGFLIRNPASICYSQQRNEAQGRLRGSIFTTTGQQAVLRNNQVRKGCDGKAGI